MLGNKKGFTLIEMVVVLAVIAILGAILAPSVSRYIENARVHRAEADCKAIASAIAKFNSDTGEWPIWVSGTNTESNDTAYRVLESALGEDATDASPEVATTPWPITAGEIDELSDVLNENLAGYPTTGRRRAWKGPYLPDISEDPWGNKYLVNVETLKPGLTATAVFVLSAGPDETIDTDYDQDPKTAALGGDDIWARIR
jgi:general secretion pathway protein G